MGEKWDAMSLCYFVVNEFPLLFRIINMHFLVVFVLVWNMDAELCFLADKFD